MRQHSRLRRAVTTTASATMMAVALILGGHAQAASMAPPFTNPDWQTFHNARWVNGDGHNSKFGLVTTSTQQSDGSVTYGGISLKAKYVPSDANSITHLSFDFKPDHSGASGGSPRMVVRFSDGGNGELRPLTWSANTWVSEDGIGGTDWDNNGGSCGFRYETTWTIIKSCHAGATITSIFLVNDSGWIVSGTEHVTLDNIRVNDITATGPGRNN